MAWGGGLSMDWFRALDGYCERTDPGFWAEPVNALSNGAFLIAAVICWRRPEVARDPAARLLCGVLAVIGVGSFLFHTEARVWAMLADVLPILGFILLYVGIATVRFFDAPVWTGWLAAALYVPLSGLVSGLIGAVAGPVNGSVSYMPVVLLIAAYAALLWRTQPSTARGLALGAAILSVSLVFRSIDMAVCGVAPVGTHFLWHGLNGVMLGWMILVLARQRERALARPVPAG